MHGGTDTHDVSMQLVEVGGAEEVPIILIHRHTHTHTSSLGHVKPCHKTNQKSCVVNSCRKTAFEVETTFGIIFFILY